LHVAYNAPHFGKGWDDVQEETVNVMQPRPEDLKRVEHLDDPLRRAFAAKVVGMDQGIGRLLEALARHGLDENTLVVFMTDHGGDPDYGGSNLPFRGGKATLYEGGLRVPCIVRWPGHVPPQSVCDEVACAVDWYATFGQLVGYGPDPTDGQSIVELLLGKPAESPRRLIWKTGAHRELGRQSWQAVRDGDWKWVKAPGRDAELFDLSRDPGESVDRSKESPEVARRMAALAEQS
jgi:arylsulfatase A-like enzyme